MKVIQIIVKLFIGIVGLVCVIACDRLLLKIPATNWFGQLIAHNWIRMGISYCLGIILFLIGLKIYAINM